MMKILFYVILSWLTVLGGLDVINWFRALGPVCASVGGGCQ